jgi:hypothetical protein
MRAWGMGTDRRTCRDPGHFSQSRNPGIRRLQSPDFGIENLIHFNLIIRVSTLAVVFVFISLHEGV